MVKATVRNAYNMVLKVTANNLHELDIICYTENLEILDYYIDGEDGDIDVVE